MNIAPDNDAAKAKRQAIMQIMRDPAMSGSKKQREIQALHTAPGHAVAASVKRPSSSKRSPPLPPSAVPESAPEPATLSSDLVIVGAANDQDRKPSPTPPEVTGETTPPEARDQGVRQRNRDAIMASITKPSPRPGQSARARVGASTIGRGRRVARIGGSRTSSLAAAAADGEEKVEEGSEIVAGGLNLPSTRRSRRRSSTSDRGGSRIADVRAQISGNAGTSASQEEDAQDDDENDRKPAASEQAAESSAAAQEDRPQPQIGAVSVSAIDERIARKQSLGNVVSTSTSPTMTSSTIAAPVTSSRSSRRRQYNSRQGSSDFAAATTAAAATTFSGSNSRVGAFSCTDLDDKIARKTAGEGRRAGEASAFSNTSNGTTNMRDNSAPVNTGARSRSATLALSAPKKSLGGSNFNPGSRSKSSIEPFSSRRNRRMNDGIGSAPLIVVPGPIKEESHDIDEAARTCKGCGRPITPPSKFRSGVEEEDFRKEPATPLNDVVESDERNEKDGINKNEDWGSRHSYNFVDGGDDRTDGDDSALVSDYGSHANGSGDFEDSNQNSGLDSRVTFNDSRNDLGDSVSAHSHSKSQASHYSEYDDEKEMARRDSMERTGELISEKSLDPKHLYNFAPSKEEPFSNSMDPHDPYHYSDNFLSGDEQMARSSKMRRESLLMDPQMQGFKLSRGDKCNICIGLVLIVIISVGISVPVTLIKTEEIKAENAPTMSPTASRYPEYNLMATTVVERTGITDDVLEDSSSSQAQALDWIAYEDPAGLSADSPNLIQRYSLMVLYYALGGQSTRLKWDVDGLEDECRWYGVDCTATPGDAPFGTASGKVNVLLLKSLGLSGTLVEELGLLMELESLNAADNMITGSLPSSLFNLTNLVHLNLELNQIGPDLNEDIGRLSKLETFILHDNAFNTELPSTIGSLKSLKKLYLYNNKFSGDIFQFMVQMPMLEEADNAKNEFSGTIPSSIGSLSNLRFLLLGQNSIKGTIPTEIGLLSNLERFGLNNNQLSGATIPTQLGVLYGLQLLELSKSNLIGEIPPELQYLTKLVVLTLDKNSLFGEIPSELGQISTLQRLTLNGNDLTGTIPTELGKIKNLVDVQLQKTSLTGTMPEEICNFRIAQPVVLQDLRADCRNKIECPEWCCTKCS